MVVGIDLDAVLAGPAVSMLDLGYHLLIEDATSGWSARAVTRTAVDRWLAGLDPEDPDGLDRPSPTAPAPRPTPPPPDPAMRAEDVPGWGWDEVGQARALSLLGGSPAQMDKMPAIGATSPTDVPLVDGAVGLPPAGGES